MASPKALFVAALCWLLTDVTCRSLQEDDSTNSTDYVYNPYMASVADAPAAFSNEYGRSLAPTLDTFPVLEQMNMMVAQATFAPCTMFEPHYHKIESEITVVMQGKLVFTVLDESLKPYRMEHSVGDVVAIPSGIVHVVENQSCEEALINSVWNRDKIERTTLGSILKQVNAIAFAAEGYGLDTATLGEVAQALDKLDAASFIAPLGSDECIKRCGLQ